MKVIFMAILLEADTDWVRSFLAWFSGGALAIIAILSGYVWNTRVKEDDRTQSLLSEINTRLSDIQAKTNKIPAIEEELKEHRKHIESLRRWKVAVNSKVGGIEYDEE